MDDAAIKRIQQTAIDSQSLRIPQDFADLGIIALPNDYSVHDLEKFGEVRRRFRGHYQTSSTEDFIAYVKQRKGEGYIDTAKQAATVFFNLGDVAGPGHGDHKATLKLEPTAAYSAMQGIDGAPCDQKALLDWLEDWAENMQAIVNADGVGTVMAWTTALHSLREVQIKAKREVETRQGDFNAGRTAMEDVEASSRVGLPAGFVFRCEPYMGLPEREFFLRLSVRTNPDKPLLVLRIVRNEVQNEAIAQDFKRLLIDGVGDDVAMTIGTFTP